MKPLSFIICFSALSFCAMAQEISLQPKQIQSQGSVNYTVPKKTILNGEHTVYNAAHQISKEGFFTDNNLINGKMYIYNEDGTLKHVEHYKNGQLTGTTPQ